MKKITILSLAVILNISCNAQENEKEEKSQKEQDNQLNDSAVPRGTWKVDKEFDENGNLIKYDSIYSWSSEDDLNRLSSLDRDSTLQSIQSRFYRNLSRLGNQRFDDIFSPDSLFLDRFFDDEFFTSQFGKDFMDVDKMYKRMEDRQKEFLEKYRSELKELDEESSKKGNL